MTGCKTLQDFSTAEKEPTGDCERNLFTAMFKDMFLIKAANMGLGGGDTESSFKIEETQ